MLGGTTEMAFDNIIGQVATKVCTPVNAESTEIALLRMSNAIATL